MRNFVDLHTHSSASDGETSPRDVVLLAERKKLAAVALTDHDTVAGIAEAMEAARGLTVRLVNGVEMSAEYPGGTLHILGLGVDIASRPFNAALERLREARRERNPRMIAKLQALGMSVSMEELLEAAGKDPATGGVVGRLHMAKLLCQKGCVPDTAAAFSLYLGAGKPAYVDKERLSAADAATAIHAGGGVAILAHPVQLKCPNRLALENVVRGLQRQGIDGIEVYHSDHSVQLTRICLDLARQLGMLISGGSDFHGPHKPDTRLGLPKVPLVAVEQLLARVAP